MSQHTLCFDQVPAWTVDQIPRRLSERDLLEPYLHDFQANPQPPVIYTQPRFVDGPPPPTLRFRAINKPVDISSPTVPEFRVYALPDAMPGLWLNAQNALNQYQRDLEAGHSAEDVLGKLANGLPEKPRGFVSLLHFSRGTT